MAQSSDRPIGERLKIAMFAWDHLIGRRGEEWRLFRIVEVFAAKSEFDLEYFR